MDGADRSHNTASSQQSSEFLQEIRDEFTYALKSGRKPAIEDFLERCGRDDRSQLLRELLQQEIEVRHKLGHKLSVNEYSSRFPDESDTLSEIFGAEDCKDNMPVDSSRPVTDSTNTFGADSDTIGGQLPVSSQSQAIGPGSVLGDYELIELIGAGGMGEVYKARHRRMKRLVGLKTLPGDLTKKPDAIQRFQREVEAAAKLDHPHVVTAYDAGEDCGVHFLVMQYIDGRDLATIVGAEGPLSVRNAIDTIKQAALGLSYAHSRGVIHRDIKPANLLIDSDQTVKVLDMGLARFEFLIDENQDKPTELTTFDCLMGTMDYMSPEQALNPRKADSRSDIYSLGCTLYFLLTGSTLFAGETIAEKMIAHREDPIPTLGTDVPGATTELNNVLQRMLAKRPEDRYDTMDSVIEALETCDAGIDDHLPLRAQHFSSHASDSSARKSDLERVRAGYAGPSLIVDRPGFTTKGLSFAIALSAILLAISLTAVTLAYNAPITTNAWLNRFDLLPTTYVRGLGWEIEALRVLIYIPASVLVFWWRFRPELRSLVTPRTQSRSVNIARILLLVVAIGFGIQETTRHLSLDGAPRDLLLSQGVMNPTKAEVLEQWYPYAVYLIYSLVNYMLIVPALAIIPLVAVMADFPRLRKQQLAFFNQMNRGLNESTVLLSFQTFEQNCQTVCARYLDFMMLLLIAVHFECWLGRFTMTSNAFMLMACGWILGAVMAAVCFMWLIALYGMAADRTREALIDCKSLNLAKFMNEHNSANFLRWLLTGRTSGLAVSLMLMLLAIWIITFLRGS